jgi:hypothetical protein
MKIKINMKCRHLFYKGQRRQIINNRHMSIRQSCLIQLLTICDVAEETTGAMLNEWAGGREEFPFGSLGSATDLYHQTYHAGEARILCR